jgi:hypothetical protein
LRDSHRLAEGEPAANHAATSSQLNFTLLPSLTGCGPKSPRERSAKTWEGETPRSRAASFVSTARDAQAMNGPPGESTAGCWRHEGLPGLMPSRVNRDPQISSATPFQSTGESFARRDFTWCLTGITCCGVAQPIGQCCRSANRYIQYTTDRHISKENPDVPTIAMSRREVMQTMETLPPVEKRGVP